MGKRLFLLLISVIIGVVKPTLLSATDTPVVSGFDDSKTVETIIEEPEPEPEPAPEPVLAPVVLEPKVAYTLPVSSNYISIAGRTLDIVDVASTTIDAGNHVNKYGDKFLYGHNSAAVFGGLQNLSAGSTFTVTNNGNTASYTIAKIVIFEKDQDSGNLELDGAGSYMNAVAKARFQGTGYDLSIMTCHGTIYGNRDASHRLVIFANRI